MFAIVMSLLLGGIIALGAYFYTKLRRPSGFPPGPPAYPLVGSLPALNVDFNADDGGYQFIDELQNLTKKYGSVFSLAIGHRWTVVISDLSLIKEAFVKLGTDLAGRPSYGAISKAWNPYSPKMSVADSTYDEQWKLQRHTVLQVLRTLGYGRNITEHCIKDEANKMIECFQAKKGESIPIKEYMSLAVANIIVSMLFGERYEYDNKEFNDFLKNVNTAFGYLQKTIVPSRFMLLNKLPAYKNDEKMLFETYSKVNSFLYKKIAENPEDDSIDDPQNFIQGYRMELKKNPALENRLFPNLTEFIHAGFETTATTLGWAFLFMVTRPDVQKKVQDEMDHVIGRSRRPTLTDRSSLPYMLATINEVFRLGSTLPTALPHYALKECKVGGYTIPKDTEVWPLIWNVLRDPEIWEDPLVFKPERFLDNDGKYNQREELVNFGVGRRSCLGEQLARQEMFIIMSNLLHTFTFSTPDKNLKQDTKGIMAFTHQPPDYHVCVENRD